SRAASLESGIPMNRMPSPHALNPHAASANAAMTSSLRGGQPNDERMAYSSRSLRAAWIAAFGPGLAYTVGFSGNPGHPTMYDIKPGQSIELLKELHILTRDGKMNQDSRRKLKQVYHLVQFIEPLLKDLKKDRDGITLVDHGSGKSYLGFILYDLFFKQLNDESHLYGIETREELVKSATDLAQRLVFPGMSFLNLSVSDSITS